MRSRTAAGGSRRQGSPFFVAHRAGNNLAQLRTAERLGLDLVEADVHLFRGRLEVRHLKTVGPVPILWDRWALASPLTPRLELHELIAATAQSTELMLDLKGRSGRLADRVREAMLPHLGTRRFTVCARAWHLLELFQPLEGVRTIHSVGNGRQLRELLRRHADGGLEGVSVHERLLDADTLAQLHRAAGIVMTWPANAAARARELLALGVDGLISDRLDLATELSLVPPSPEPA